jgi:uncharacterized coiled-coil DUF342 family protein
MNTDIQLDSEPVALTKEIIRERADSIIQLIDEGHLKATQVALNVKSMTDLFDAVKDELRGRVLDELNAYTKGEEVTLFGATFEVIEAGTKYDYSGCNDAEYDELSQQINELTARRKDREKFLRSIKNATTIVNEETGELVRILPPVKTSTTTYKTTWSK